MPKTTLTPITDPKRQTQPGSLLRASLARVFGLEWATLDESDRQLILRDVTEDGGVSDLAEYRSNIGRGNLLAYAKTQRVRFARKG